MLYCDTCYKLYFIAEICGDDESAQNPRRKMPILARAIPRKRRPRGLSQSIYDESADRIYIYIYIYIYIMFIYIYIYI